MKTILQGLVKLYCMIFYNVVIGQKVSTTFNKKIYKVVDISFRKMMSTKPFIVVTMTNKNGGVEHCGIGAVNTDRTQSEDGLSLSQWHEEMLF